MRQSVPARIRKQVISAKKLRAVNPFLTQQKNEIRLLKTCRSQRGAAGFAEPKSLNSMGEVKVEELKVVKNNTMGVIGKMLNAAIAPRVCKSAELHQKYRVPTQF